MTNLKWIILVLVPLVWSCNQRAANESGTESDTISVQSEAAMDQEVSISQVWASDTVLQTPESVLYDQNGDVIYVANINGQDPRAKDGNGFISKMNTEGGVTDLQWATGLDAPKGMGIHENALFVTDIDQLVEINLETGEISNRFPVEGAQFLNDVAISPEGVVYFTDSDQAKIHQLENGQVSVVVEGSQLNRPNGLFYQDGNLMLASSGDQQLKRVDLNSKEVAVLVDGIGHGDGVVPDGEGNFIVSSWQGEVFFISQDWDKTQLLDTRDQEINSADIDYIIDQNLLLVPTFFDNRVVAYSLNK
ncbi:MAG: SMP-30/gluconolactonase/LRE family protein [Candidatus Cyclobacteriaceae bacterium M3_2C_046]